MTAEMNADLLTFLVKICIYWSEGGSQDQFEWKNICHFENRAVFLLVKLLRLFFAFVKNWRVTWICSKWFSVWYTGNFRKLQICEFSRQTACSIRELCVITMRRCMLLRGVLRNLLWPQRNPTPSGSWKSRRTAPREGWSWQRANVEIISCQ